jgi:predicted lipopolysaccharide heptosyltransferase III
LKILLVRPRLIGDVLLTTPVIRALRRRFPDAEIVYVVESLAAPVVRDNPHVSSVIEIRHRRGVRRVIEDLSLGWRLRKQRFDVAIDMHGGPRSSWLTVSTRAPVRVGYDVPGRRWMYTRLVPRPRGYAPRHSVLNQWDLAAAVDAAFEIPPDAARDRLEMTVTRESAETVRRRFAELGLARDAAPIVLHVAAGNEFRRWPADRFAAVAADLARDGQTVLVVGSTEDAPTIRDVARSARSISAASTVIEAPGWPLSELRALMERAALFVGGDSGPMHIAAASDVPIVALFGPTLPVHWAPWRPPHLPFVAIEPGPLECRPCDQRVCAPGDFRCLRDLTAARVVSAARALLNNEVSQ